MKRWIEHYLVHGEGDVLGERVVLPVTWWYVLNRLYEYDPLTGALAHDFALIGMGKGNGKTEILGQVADAELAGPIAPERSPLVVLSAAAYDQSDELFRAARLSIVGDPDHGRPGPLLGYFRENEHLLEDRIFLPDGVGLIKRITSVGGTNDGGKPTAHLGDEVHEWHTERSRRVHTVQAKSLAKRRVPRRTPATLRLPDGVRLWGGIRVYITTAGADHDSLLGRLYDHGMAVAQGKVADPGFLFLWWEGEEHWDLEDPDQRRQALLEANPEAGRHLPLANLERSYADPTVARSEFVRYNLNRFPDDETAWFSRQLWDATTGDVVLDPILPVYAVLRTSSDNRAAGIAIAQRQGDIIVVRVEHQLPTAGEYLNLAALAKSLAELRRLYPALVMAPRRPRPNAALRVLPTPGPKIVLSGGFLEGIAQQLRTEQAAIMDIPDSPPRRRAAADTLRSVAEQGRLRHEADPQLARQFADIVERPAASTTYLEPRVGRVICGAIAACEAVRQVEIADQAPPPKRTLHTFS